MRRSFLKGTSNNGLVFVHLVTLFQQMPAGQIIGLLFFLALTFAALSSTFPMLELVARFFMDAGMPRKKALLVGGIIMYALGAPSAMNVNFLDNQDWVWGVGLLVSGLFFSLAAIKKGSGQDLERGYRAQCGPEMALALQAYLPLPGVVRDHLRMVGLSGRELVSRRVVEVLARLRLCGFLLQLQSGNHLLPVGDSLCGCLRSQGMAQRKVYVSVRSPEPRNPQKGFLRLGVRENKEVTLMSWQVNMVIVLLVVWGGFALCIKKTMSSEAEKK